MKKVLRTIAIFLAVVLMSGCVKYNVDIKVSNDGKMDMTFIAAVSSSLQEGATETTDEEAIEKLKNAGWKVEEYKDETYSGSKLTKSFGHVDTISSAEEVIVDLNEFGEKGDLAEKLFQKTTKDGKTVYVAKFKVDLSSATGTDTATEEGTEETEDDSTQQMQAMMQQMMSTMDLKFTVEVPNVVSSNATTTEGNKLTWDLSKLESGKNIEFTFSLPGGGSSFPIVPVAIGIGAVVVIGIIVAVVLSKKKNGSEPVAVIQDEMAAPVTPTTPVAPVVPENATLAGPEVAPVETAPATPEVPVAPAPVETPVEPVAPVEAPVDSPVAPVETPVMPEAPVAPVTEIPTEPTEPTNTDNTIL